MKPLIILIAVFIISLLATKLCCSELEVALSGRIAMSAMLAFTAIGHFAFNKGMAKMLPAFIPYKTQVVYLTGIIEIAAAAGLLLPHFRVLTGWLLIVFFVLILPANIHAAIKRIDYQKATVEGNGLSYLWFRIPLQVLFIIWTYLFAIKACCS